MMILAYSRNGSTQANGSHDGHQDRLPESVFLTLLDRLGDLRHSSTADDFQRDVQTLRHTGLDGVIVSFVPPTELPSHPGYRVIYVCAWSAYNLAADYRKVREAWLRGLERAAAVITTSHGTAADIRQHLGEHFPVFHMNSPLAWKIPASRQPGCKDPSTPKTVRATQCSIVDTQDFVFHAGGFTPAFPLRSFFTPHWDGTPLQMDFNCQSPDAGRLLGFYEPETWGAWSRTATPCIVLPATLQGHVDVLVEAAGYGHNAGKIIEASIGSSIAQLALGPNHQTLEISLKVSEPCNLLSFRGLDPMEAGTADDNRPLGMALRRVWIRHTPDAHHDDNTHGRAESATAPPCEASAGHCDALTLTGITYLSIMRYSNPDDNFIDTVTAFCHAFRHFASVTLVICVTHDPLGIFLGKLAQLLEQMQPFSCRIITLEGKIDATLLAQLSDAADFYVKISNAPTVCTETIGLMAMGLPGITTEEKTVKDLTTQESHYIVESTASSTTPRNIDAITPITTTRFRTHWESLEYRFRQSHTERLNNPDKYLAMAHRCQAIASDYLKSELTTDALQHFLASHATA